MLKCICLLRSIAFDKNVAIEPKFNALIRKHNCSNGARNISGNCWAANDLALKKKKIMKYK
jgi:hypothetical protein